MPQLDVFRKTLAEKLGKVLTPEDAAQIESIVFSSQDLAHKPTKFGQQIYKGLSFQVERFLDVVDELHPLHQAHFSETEKHRLGFGMDPDYEAFAQSEKAGQLIQFTARDVSSDKLVGNIRMYIGTSLHTGTLFAAEDTFYLLPDYRSGFTAIRFWQFMEGSVRLIGVREIRTDSKVVNKVHRLNEYLGYTHVANKYVKIFED